MMVEKEVVYERHSSVLDSAVHELEDPSLRQTGASAAPQALRFDLKLADRRYSFRLVTFKLVIMYYV